MGECYNFLKLSSSFLMMILYLYVCYYPAITQETVQVYLIQSCFSKFMDNIHFIPMIASDFKIDNNKSQINTKVNTKNSEINSRRWKDRKIITCERTSWLKNKENKVEVAHTCNKIQAYRVPTSRRIIDGVMDPLLSAWVQVLVYVTLFSLRYKLLTK